MYFFVTSGMSSRNYCDPNVFGCYFSPELFPDASVALFELLWSWGRLCSLCVPSHCRISYGGGLGTSPCIMRLTTQDPYILKEHIELYKILKFRVNWANTEQDTAIQKLQNLLRNVWVSGQESGNPYIC